MANGDGNHVTVDIEEMLPEAQPLFTPECCIYKVPHFIRQLNQDAYTPKIVSIGPFHHGNTRLKNMEGQKQLYCQHFIERSEATLDDLESCVRKLEPRVRSCYSENIELGVDELFKVILVDCGFIIELMSRFMSRLCSRQLTWDDAIILVPCLGGSIRHDLLLLENQLPFFVFDQLYKLAFASSLNGDQHPPFLELASNFFKHFNKRGVLPSSAGSIAHFTDLLRTYYLPPSIKLAPRKHEMLNLCYSASELNEAGVKFTVNKSSQCHSILDLEFSGCILKIPQIKVEDSTELLFRNMLALEQFQYPRASYITDYVRLLDLLINTDKDVDVLVKDRIIVNLLGDNNSVAELFNGLGKNIWSTGSNIECLRTCKQLNGFYESCWHTKMATLRRDYCDTPWKTAASIAGIALLILTVIQTICSILQVVHQV